MKTMVLFLALSTICAVAAETAPLTLPFEETFSSGQIDSTWTQKVSEDGSLKIVDNWLAVDHHENGHAHIQRSLGVNNITVTAKIYSCASIYVVFDENNWCGVGRVSPTPFPRFYSTLTVDGTTTEVDHRGCTGGSPPFVRIQLARDCIRFQYSNDCIKWETMKTAARSGAFSGPPALAAFGKHYSPGMKPFADGTPAAVQNPGIKYYGAVTSISIEKTPDKELRMTAADRRKLNGTDIYETTNLLLRGEDDPTFDNTAKIFPEMKWPREVVGVPEHPLDIGVDYYGRLDVSPWSTTPVAWFEIGDPGTPLGGEGIRFKRRLLDGYLPVLSLTRKDGDLQYEMTVYGWSEGMSTDSDLYAYVHLKAKGSREAKLPEKLTMVYDGGSKRSEWKMLPARGAATETFLRIKYPEPATASIVTAGEFESRKAETIACWRDRIKKAEIFDIPDKRVNEAYRAWLVYWMLNADKINGYTELHDGAGFYDSMFGYSISLHNMALDMYGLHDYAAQCLDTQIHFQRSNGLYLQDCGLPDHGSLLLALATHYEMTDDSEWLKRVAPQVVKACEWIVNQRKEAPKSGVTRGLIKFRPYNDYPQPVFNYHGNAYACIGLETCSEALRSIGMTAEADKYAYEARKYRKDILRSMEAAVFKDGDMEILPLEPDTHRLLKLSKYLGSDYYGLTASCVLEHDFLGAYDRPAQLIVDMLEKRRGLIAGVSEFMEGIDHAYTYGYLMNQMKRDNIQKVILGFQAMLAHGMTRDTYSPVEVTMLATGENHLTLPHSYSCTQQLRLLRNMLVREDGNRLWLGQAIPRYWLDPGKRLSVNSAPTRFGPVSYRISSNGDGSMNIRLDPPTRKIPEEIIIRLRHPKQLAISEVSCSPSIPLTFSGETIVIKKLTKPAEITVRFHSL